MRGNWVYKKLWEVLIFDKRFNGVPKDKQKSIASFSHLSAKKLKELKVNNGNVRLISTGLFDGYTTEELAGDYLNSGEIITIPTGGVANIKYHNGLFVDSGNIIGIAGVKDLKMKFVYYFLLCNKKQIDSYFRGVGIKHPYMPDICEMTIPLPPKAEQERIVTELDLLLSIIDKKKEQLKACDQLAQSIFYDMFGNPIDNPLKWEVKKLGDICNKISDGVHAKPKYTESGMPFISVININNGYLSFNDCKFVSLNDGEVINKRSRPEKGDILYTKVGATYGIPALVDTDTIFCLYVSVCLIKPKHNLVDSIFLRNLMALPYVKNQADDRIRGIGVPDLHLNQISSFNIILPPLSLQQLFAEKIEAIEAQKALIQQSITETITLFNSRMDYYFS